MSKTYIIKYSETEQEEAVVLTRKVMCSGIEHATEIADGMSEEGLTVWDVYPEYSE